VATNVSDLWPMLSMAANKLALQRQRCRYKGHALQINMTAGKTPTLVARFRQIGDLIMCFVKEARGSFFLVQAPGSLRSQPIL
jgi:hypothetical protein